MTTESWIVIIAAAQAAHILVHILLRSMSKFDQAKLDEVAKEARAANFMLDRVWRIENDVSALKRDLCALHDKTVTIGERTAEHSCWFNKLAQHLAPLADRMADYNPASPPVGWTPAVHWKEREK